MYFYFEFAFKISVFKLNAMRIIKKYNLGSSLPVFFYEVCKNQLLELVEEKIVSANKSKSCIKVILD